MKNILRISFENYSINMVGQTANLSISELHKNQGFGREHIWCYVSG
jgi:hypothetical protein